jgi:hypothetical protein
MKTIRCAVLLFTCMLLTMLTASLAEAGTGTLKFTFKYKDPGTGVTTNVGKAFAYLHVATKPPPMEKYFTRADQILWGSLGNGSYNIINVPEGTYYIRINQRMTLPQTTQGSFGPPQAGDLTWMQTAPITIVAGQTLDLGTLYATPFGPAPITITGTVKNSSGAPLAGRYVRAQTEPCIADGYNNDINQCGPVKDLALQPTDANGKYTLVLRDPGTYYLYTSPCLTNVYDAYTGNRCHYSAAPNPVLVKIRDVKTVDIIAY